VRDTGPRDAEDTGIADEGSIGEFRQLPIEARRQIAADLADLFFDQMVIVEQPLGCGRDGGARAHRGCDRAICSEQDRLVLAQPGIE
jgi:hypothetical protein